MATTVLAGRYVTRQKSRMVVPGSARIPSSSPQISRPAARPPNSAAWNRIWRTRSGRRGSERISSMMTDRSPSISSLSSFGRTMSSPRTSIASGRLAPGTRTQ